MFLSLFQFPVFGVCDILEFYRTMCHIIEKEEKSDRMRREFVFDYDLISAMRLRIPS